MFFKKKEEKKLRYVNEWFISEMNLSSKTYYSKDGLNFTHSRTDRKTMEYILNNFDTVKLSILTIESKNEGTISATNKRRINLRVSSRVLSLMLETL